MNVGQDVPHLSKRELEVMRLAARGLTDQAIANRLGIGVATVGTYWNRIRSKMGSHSRTELVAQYLKVEAHGAISRLREENSQLHEELARKAQAQISLELFHTLLETAPDAILVVDGEGFIKLANEQAAALFGYTKREMTGLHVRTFVPKRHHGRHNILRQQFMAHPEKRAMGDHNATSAVKRDGTEFPIAATLSAFKAGTEMLVTCIIRPI
jgi:PAS domain S-box-containing protein